MKDMNFTFQEDLLKWYEQNKRDLSFRKKKDAYQIWISEIMAQQTRIEAMLPYFDRFIKVLPSMKDLAEVDDQKLNKLWQGLGYYSRARNLKKCAIVCIEQYDGKLPQTKKELMNLPGIGSYIAGAIASIAYDENVSAIDGNVNRVFSRLYLIKEDLRKTKGKKEIEKVVDASLPGSKYISAYNQALMELGALICIPKNPRCKECPISKYCQAYLYADPSKLPVLSKLKKRKIVNKEIYVLIHENKIRLHQREEKGLLHGLYGFDEKKPEIYRKKKELKSYTHIFSHVEWHMNAWVVFVDWEDENFYTLDEIKKDIPIPSAFLPFLNQIEKIF